MFGYRTFTVATEPSVMPGRPWMTQPCDFIAPVRLWVASNPANLHLSAHDARSHYKVWSRRKARLVVQPNECAATYRFRWFGITRPNVVGDWRFGPERCELVGALLVKGKGQNVGQC